MPYNELQADLLKLEQIKQELQKTLEEWSGEEPGLLEERAKIAEEAQQSLTSVIAMLTELDTYSNN